MNQPEQAPAAASGPAPAVDQPAPTSVVGSQQNAALMVNRYQGADGTGKNPIGSGPGNPFGLPGFARGG